MSGSMNFKRTGLLLTMIPNNLLSISLSLKSNKVVAIIKAFNIIKSLFITGWDTECVYLLSKEFKYLKEASFSICANDLYCIPDLSSR